MSTSRPFDPESAPADLGATMVEYALIVGAIALVVAFGAGVFGQGVFALFDDMLDAL